MTIEKISDEELRETTVRTITKTQLLEIKAQIEAEILKQQEPFDKALEEINAKLGLFDTVLPK